MNWLSKLLKRKSAKELDITRVTQATAAMEPVKAARPQRKDAFMEMVVVTEAGDRMKGIALDVSKTGARIRFQTTAALPSRIRLKIPKLKFDRDVDVIWRKGVDAGVKFA